MSDLLVIFGFAWMTLSAALGLQLGIKHESHAAALEQLAREGQLLDYHRQHSAYRQRVTVHAHGFLFSLVCIAAALAMPQVAYSTAIRDGLATALMGATVLWFCAGLVRLRPLMGIADFIFLGSLIATVVGLAKGLQ